MSVASNRSVLLPLLHHHLYLSRHHSLSPAVVLPNGTRSFAGDLLLSQLVMSSLPQYLRILVRITCGRPSSV